MEFHGLAVPPARAAESVFPVVAGHRHRGCSDEVVQDDGDMPGNADRAARQEARADALAEKADQDAATAAQQRARDLGAQIPFGQPILVCA